MKAADDVSSLPAFLGAAFFFGMIHALMPGHGKSVLVSFHLGRPSRIVDGLTTGALLSLTHVGIAGVFVLAGVAVISRSLAAAGRAPAFEVVSAALIVLIGAYLIYRVVHPPAYVHSVDGTHASRGNGASTLPAHDFHFDVCAGAQRTRHRDGGGRRHAGWRNSHHFELCGRRSMRAGPVHERDGENRRMACAS